MLNNFTLIKTKFVHIYKKYPSVILIIPTLLYVGTIFHVSFRLNRGSPSLRSPFPFQAD